LPLVVLEQKWLEVVRNTYVAEALPPKAELVILTVMGLLFLLAIAVRWRQRMEIRRQMQEQEQLQQLFQRPDVTDIAAAEGVTGDSDEDVWYT